MARARPTYALSLVIPLVVVGIMALADQGSGALARSTSAATTPGCAGTLPNRAVQPGAGFGPGGFDYGNERLRVQLNWSRGVLQAGVLPGGGSIATINPDGSVSAKVGWWIRDVGKLSIVGRRLDRLAPPIRVRIPSAYGPAFNRGATLGSSPRVSRFRPSAAGASSDGREPPGSRSSSR